MNPLARGSPRGADLPIPPRGHRQTFWERGGAVVEARGVVVATVLAALMLVGLLGYAAGRYSTELFPQACDQTTSSSASCR